MLIQKYPFSYISQILHIFESLQRAFLLLELFVLLHNYHNQLFMKAVFLKDAKLTNKRSSQLANFIFPLIQWIFSFMLFLKMMFFITLFHYRNASVTEKTYHLNCIFTKEVFAAPDVITNSALLTNFNVFKTMFQLSVIIVTWCTTCTSDSQL